MAWENATGPCSLDFGHCTVKALPLYILRSSIGPNMVDAGWLSFSISFHTWNIVNGNENMVEAVFELNPLQNGLGMRLDPPPMR